MWIKANKTIKDRRILFTKKFNGKKKFITRAKKPINIKPNKERMLALSNEGYTTATDFADYLVKNKNMSFREAYKVSAKLVNYAEKNKKKLNQLNFEEVAKMNNKLDKNVMKVFNVRNSVNLKYIAKGLSLSIYNPMDAIS